MIMNPRAYESVFGAGPQPSQSEDKDKTTPYGMMDSGDFAKVIHELVNDADVSEEVKSRFNGNPLFAGLMKTIKLTFFTELDAEVMRHRFEEMVCAFIESLDKGEYTPQVDMLIQNLRILWHSNTKRSVGSVTGAMNERTALLTVAKHNIFSEKGSGSGIKSIFGRILGRK